MLRTILFKLKLKPSPSPNLTIAQCFRVSELYFYRAVKGLAFYFIQHHAKMKGLPHEKRWLS